MSPYYTERFGREAKQIADKLLENEDTDIIIPKTSMLISVSSAYLRFYYGWRWIIDNSDPDGRYHKLRKRVTLNRTKQGVVFTWDNKTPTMQTLSVDQSMDFRQSPHGAAKQWREAVEHFLENAQSGDKLELDNLALDNEEIDALKESFVGILNLHHQITATFINLWKI